MAAYATKIFALFALLALSASAATAITTMQYFPPMMAMGTMDPCRQYMMQTLGMGSSTAMFMSQPMAFLRQQCCMQMQLQAMMPQCHCDASCQMMQNMQQVICGGLEHQQMMKMAMDMPYMCNMAHQQMMKKMAMDMPYTCNMAPTNFQLSPYDFGWAVRSNAKRHTLCGTIDYLAPEMVEKKAHDHAVDNWTLGILCYEFLYGSPPFEAAEQDDTLRRIIKVDLLFPTTPYVSADAKDLISKLLVKDSSKRLSLDDIMKHPWIVKNADPSGSCIEQRACT
ncbi:hypothetical protein ABZP36_004631 [Zizania latifolia]